MCVEHGLVTKYEETQKQHGKNIESYHSLTDDNAAIEADG